MDGSEHLLTSTEWSSGYFTEKSTVVRMYLLPYLVDFSNDLINTTLTLYKALPFPLVQEGAEGQSFPEASIH